MVKVILFSAAFMASLVFIFVFAKMITKWIKYFFVPEILEIRGEIIKVFIKPEDYPPLSLANDNSHYSFVCAESIPVDFYYVKIWEPMSGEYYIISIDFEMYKELDERLNHLLYEITIPCKKYMWSDELTAC